MEFREKLKREVTKIQEAWKDDKSDLHQEDAYSLLCYIDLLNADVVAHEVEVSTTSNLTNVQLLTTTIELALGEGSLEAIARRVADAGGLLPQTLTDEQVADLSWVQPDTPPDTVRADLMYLGRYGRPRDE